jgi:hypothetical protein
LCLPLHVKVGEGIEHCLGPSHAREDGEVHVNVRERMVDQVTFEVDEILVQRTLDNLRVCGWGGVVLKVCVQADELHVLIF